MEPQKESLSVPVAIILAGIIIALAIVFTQMPVSQRSVVDQGGPEDSVVSEKVIINKVTEGDHVRGGINAPVTIIEFSDTECPFCKVFHETMKTVVDEYDGKVAWVYRHFPLDALHTKARKEAEATECAAKLGGHEAFWKYIDLVFEKTTSNDGLDLSLLPTFAQQIGLNQKDFEKCLENGDTAEIVIGHEKDAKAAGGTGTPHNVLLLSDGRTFPIRGALPLENMKSIIDAALDGKI